MLNELLKILLVCSFAMVRPTSNIPSTIPTSTKTTTSSLPPPAPSVVHFDTTFILEYLANRDLYLVDAFLHRSFFVSIREYFVNEATFPSEEAQDYPPKHQRLLPLLYNAQLRRNTLSDLIIPRIPNPIEDQRVFTDLFAQHSVTLSRFRHILAFATATTSLGYAHLQHIANSIKHNLNVSSESFTSDDDELPTTKQLLGLRTRDHNVDSVVKLLKEATLSATTPANSTVSTQSTTTTVTT
ncbi:unnamed protein product [Haemonchus placei]|uniref:LisH domain-containing protein n=1 Tax=Haemonchus placei TaxID=6290 RepID=A0A0N4WCS9_HAEPC|nr:unnamed protein product [Haemonchus placei]